MKLSRLSKFLILETLAISIYVYLIKGHTYEVNDKYAIIFLPLFMILTSYLISSFTKFRQYFFWLFIAIFATYILYNKFPRYEDEIGMMLMLATILPLGVGFLFFLRIKQVEYECEYEENEEDDN